MVNSLQELYDSIIDGLQDDKLTNLQLAQESTMCPVQELALAQPILSVPHHDPHL